MSGSKLLRLCSLFLCLLLCLANFSVVANAGEAEENLVNSDFANWEYLFFSNSNDPPDLQIQGSSSQFFKTVGWNSTFGTSALDGAVIYNLTNLTVGENYSLNFSCYPSGAIFEGYVEYYVGIGYYDINTGELNDFDDKYLVLKGDDFGGTYISGGYKDLVNYKDFEINFTYNEKLGSPCVFIQWVIVQPPPQSTNFFMSFVKDSFSLTRQPSETEKKLDGILGWLQDIKDTIVGLPDTIKTNFQTFFTDLQGSITTMKDSITDKLGTISTEFSGYITGLGETVSGFFTDLWNKFSAFFEKFKPRIEIPLTFSSYNNGYRESDFFIPYSDKFYLQLPYAWYLDIYDLQGNQINFVSVTPDFNYQFLKPYYTEYYQFRIRIYGTGNTEPSSIYVDSGWLSAVFDGFKYQFYSLKIRIDIKIEEIKTSIHDFFVPPEGFFEEWKVTFDLMLSDNLGFIYQAPNFVIDIVEVIQEILQSDQEVNLVFPEVEFDIAGYHVELFKNTKVDFSFLEAGIWLTLYSMYKVILYVIFALALIKYGMSTWERTMSN